MTYIVFAFLFCSASSIFAAGTDIQPTISKLTITLSVPHHGDPYSKPYYGYGYEDTTTKLYAFYSVTTTGEKVYEARIPGNFISGSPQREPIIYTGKEAQEKYEKLKKQYDTELLAISQAKWLAQKKK